MNAQHAPSHSQVSAVASEPATVDDVSDEEQGEEELDDMDDSYDEAEHERIIQDKKDKLLVLVSALVRTKSDEELVEIHKSLAQVNPEMAEKLLEL